MNTFIFLKFLGTLALPPASLVPGFVVAGILAVLRYRRAARLIVVLTVVQLLVLSTAPVADMLIWPLQRQALAEARAAKPCCYDAIVVLGGAIAGPEGSYSPTPSITPASNRLWEAARLYKAGAAPHIIVSGGENVASREVEDVLHHHPGVLEVAVVGVPDDHWGEVVCAAVVARPGAMIDAEQVIDVSRAHLASYKKPRHVVFVDSLPRNTSGKVMKHVLREQVAEMLGVTP